MKKVWLIWIGLLFLSGTVIGQQSYPVDSVITVTISNQEKVTGKVVGEDDIYLYMIVDKDKLSIPKKNILYHSESKSGNILREEGEYRNYADQYFLMPSAIPVNKGEIYYRNIDLVGHLFSFGLTDRFSINAGFESYSIFSGDTPVIIVTPKFNIPYKENFHIGVGASTFLHEDDFAAFLFGNATIGSRKNNLTLGVGLATDGEEIVEDPFLSLGYAVSLSEKLGIYGDFISTPVFDDDDFDGIFTFNFRFRFKGGIAFDIGAITNAGFNGAIPSLAVILPLN